MPLIGGHVSAAGGLMNAVANGEAIGATCIQIFGSSPRQWRVRMPSVADAEEFKSSLSKSSIKKVFLHAPYLVNLASPSARLRAVSIDALAGHMRIAEMIGAEGVIFHVGSGKEMPHSQALKIAVSCMKKVLDKSSGKALLIIENSAGGGRKLGATPEDVAALMQGVRSSRVKACLDTAHAFEAGIIRFASEREVKDHVAGWDRVVGLKNIVALHANDSKTPFDSHNDRHENIGEGHIGAKGFRLLAKERRLWAIPWLLEVPGFTDEGPDQKNIKLLIKCFK